MKTIDQSYVDHLQAHAKIHQLNEVAARGISEWLQAPDLGPLPEGVTKESIVGKFASRWLCFEPQLVPYPFVDTRFDLLSGDSVIGYYRLISLLNGEFEDDYFVFNQ